MDSLNNLQVGTSIWVPLALPVRSCKRLGLPSLVILANEGWTQGLTAYDGLAEQSWGQLPSLSLDSSRHWQSQWHSSSSDRTSEPVAFPF